MKKLLLFTIFVTSIFFTTDFSTKIFAKEITNIQWKKSVAKGKKLSKFRETVTSPALGKKAWKITLLPRDCGRDKEGDYSDCQNNGRDAVVGKADKCEDLWSGCSEIISQLTGKSQLNGVRVVVYCKTAFKLDNGASCRNLGYPQNQRPF